VPDLVERVKEATAGDDDVQQGDDAAPSSHQPPFDAGQLEQNRRARAERRQRRRELQGTNGGRGAAAATGTAPEGRTGENRGSQRKNSRRGKRGSRRGSARSASKSNRGKSS
jgi:hypothetical protein